MFNEAYIDSANKLRDRIVDLIPERPEIMNIENTWDLLDVDGLSFSDLDPTLAQASWALEQAKIIHKKALSIIAKNRRP
jgi:hypothetical protein